MNKTEIAALLDAVGNKSNEHEIEKLRGDLKKTDVLMVGVIIVFFIAFLGMAVSSSVSIVDAYRAREASYQDLIDRINQMDRLFIERTAEHKSPEN